MLGSLKEYRCPEKELSSGADLPVVSAGYICLLHFPSDLACNHHKSELHFYQGGFKRCCFQTWDSSKEVAPRITRCLRHLIGYGNLSWVSVCLKKWQSLRHLRHPPFPKRSLLLVSSSSNREKLPATKSWDRFSEVKITYRPNEKGVTLSRCSTVSGRTQNRREKETKNTRESLWL